MRLREPETVPYFHLGTYSRLNKVNIYWLVYYGLDFSLLFLIKNKLTNTKEHLLTFTETLISMCTHFLICEEENNDGNYLIWSRKLVELIYLKAHNRFFFMLLLQ